MKCKICNNELIQGVQKCPYCGAVVSSAGKSLTDEFKWNVQDYPKPKKTQDISIDWRSGRILDKDSGMIYDQSLNSWTEPDEIRDLFSFDTKNEKHQLALDKEMDKLSGSSSAERSRKFPSDSTFHLPASMDFRMSDEFSSLLNESAETITNDSAPLSGQTTQTQEKTPAAAPAKQTEDRNITASPLQAINFHRLSDALKEDGASSHDRFASPSYTESTNALHNSFGKAFSDSRETHSSDYRTDSVENEKQEIESDAKQDSSVEFLGFSRLIEAEKRFKEDMEKVTFLSPAEYEEAERAETQSQKLRFVPTISFRTLEDEYESHRRDNNIPRASKNEDKEVEIKIHEPSGTKVTVKTQEISLASLEKAEKIKTKEVCLDAVKQPPKNVQVSVEVNAAQGNASVEVTRRHDGATVVKTVDQSDSGHIYMDGEDLTDYSDASSRSSKNTAPTETVSDATASRDQNTAPAETVSDATASRDQNTAPAETVSGATASRDLKPTDIADGSTSLEAAQQTMQIPAATAEAMAAAIAEKNARLQAGMKPQISDMPVENQDQSSFWDISDDISKMTITDIFGPEAHKIIEEGQKNGANAAVSAPNTVNSPQPASDEAQLKNRDSHQISQSEAQREAPSESAVSDSSVTTDKAHFKDSLILDIRPEDIAASKAQTDSIQMPAVDPGSGMRGVTTDTISQARQAEMQEAFDAIDTLKETERKSREKEEKIAEHERLKAEKAVQKAEKARQKARKKAEKEEKEDTSEERLGSVAKGLIIALAAVLIIEFAVIGTKLFAPDSGAATLIHRFESQITGIFSSDGDAVSDNDTAMTADKAALTRITLSVPSKKDRSTIQLRIYFDLP